MINGRSNDIRKMFYDRYKASSIFPSSSNNTTSNLSQTNKNSNKSNSKYTPLNIKQKLKQDTTFVPKYSNISSKERYLINMGYNINQIPTKNNKDNKKSNSKSKSIKTLRKSFQSNTDNKNCPYSRRSKSIYSTCSSSIAIQTEPDLVPSHIMYNISNIFFDDKKDKQNKKYLSTFHKRSKSAKNIFDPNKDKNKDNNNVKIKAVQKKYENDLKIKNKKNLHRVGIKLSFLLLLTFFPTSHNFLSHPS